MDFKALIKAYQVIKADDDKQKAYKKWLKQPATLGMIEELSRTSDAIQKDIHVKLNDGTELTIPAKKQELPANRYLPGF